MQEVTRYCDRACVLYLGRSGTVATTTLVNMDMIQVMTQWRLIFSSMYLIIGRYPANQPLFSG